MMSATVARYVYNQQYTLSGVHCVWLRLQGQVRLLLLVREVCWYVGVQVGQVDLSSNQSGPHVHSVDGFTWSADIPLVGRSAGLSAEDVNDQMAVRKASSL